MRTPLSFFIDNEQTEAQAQAQTGPGEDEMMMTNGGWMATLPKCLLPPTRTHATQLLSPSSQVMEHHDTSAGENKAGRRGLSQVMLMVVKVAAARWATLLTI
jgi:hypothetical protein